MRTRANHNPNGVQNTFLNKRGMGQKRQTKVSTDWRHTQVVEENNSTHNRQDCNNHGKVIPIWKPSPVFVKNRLVCLGSIAIKFFLVTYALFNVFISRESSSFLLLFFTPASIKGPGLVPLNHELLLSLLGVFSLLAWGIALICELLVYNAIAWIDCKNRFLAKTRDALIMLLLIACCAPVVVLPVTNWPLWGFFSLSLTFSYLVLFRVFSGNIGPG